MADEDLNGVTFNLDGEEKQLKPTLRAALLLSRQPGGLLGVAQRISQFNMDDILLVIKFGMELTDPGAKHIKLDDKVYRTGLLRLAPVCNQFIDLLVNGGRPSGAVGEREVEQNQDADPQMGQ